MATVGLSITQSRVAIHVPLQNTETRSGLGALLFYLVAHPTVLLSSTERVPAVSHRKAATWGRTLRQDQRERSRPPLEQPCSSPTSGRLNFHRGDSYFLAHVLAAREGADGGKELAGHRLFGSGCASDAPSGPARASL